MTENLRETTVKNEKRPLPVDVRRSKTLLLKLPIGHSSCYWACKGLQAHKGLKGILGLLGVTKDYKGLRGVTRVYRWLQRV